MASPGFFLRNRRLRDLVLGAIALGVAMAPRVASAQVSEADRQAARELFQEGYQLQQAGSYAEALDKFKRAQAVFSAPTNLLHIAECEAQMGLLVESVEHYRGLIGITLPPGSPPAFAAAQTQGKAEVQQVEARIPKIRIEVAPASAQNVGILIDGQPMSTALLGVDRPIDPGTHKIRAFAQGYGMQEATVIINEKEPPKGVSFTLPPAPGVTYAPMPIGQRRVLVQPGLYGPTYAVPQGPSYALAPPTWTPPPHDWTTMGLLFGARIGAAIPSSSGSSAGVGFGAEGYFRFAHKWFLGAVLEHDQYGSAGSSQGSTLIAPDIGFSTNPEGVGFTMDLFGGYRGFSSGGGGAEGGIGMGIWIAAGKYLRIIPRAEVSGGSVGDGSSYALFFVGASVLYNLDFKPKEVVASPAP